MYGVHQNLRKPQQDLQSFLLKRENNCNKWGENWEENGKSVKMD